jgi:hypothetical protein
MVRILRTPEVKKAQVRAAQDRYRLRHPERDKLSRYIADKKYKALHAEKIAFRKAARRKVRMELIAKCKDVPCADCGGRFPTECMDFDHVRGVKKFSIGTEAAAKYWPTLLTEIEKCDIVCANCHRTRTFKRGWRNCKAN